MSIRSKKIICILMLFILIVMNFTIKDVYAASEEEELIALLNQYKNDLGDLEELKQAIDQTYNDVNSATSVDDNLKEKLNNDIDQLKNVNGINPLIANALEVELKSQIGNLTDENLEELKYEISIIKNWVDQQIAEDGTTNNNNNNNENNNRNR